MGTKHDFDAWETLAVMLGIAFSGAIGVLSLLVLLFNIPIFAMEKLTILGYVFGLGGIFFAVLLIRNWNRDRH